GGGGGRGPRGGIARGRFVRPGTKFAATAESTAEMPGLVDEALALSLQPHSGPTVVDFPLDLAFSAAAEPEAAPSLPDPAAGPEPDGDDLARAIALLRDAERPVIMAGSNLYWAHGEAALQALAEERGIPVFLNGLARGCVPADHALASSRARSTALKGADVALVVGVPMDFRLGFGQSFGEETEIVAIDRAEPVHEHPREPAAELYGGIAGILDALRSATRGATDTSAWVAALRTEEDERRA